MRAAVMTRGELRQGGRALAGAALLATPAFAQSFIVEPVPLERVSAPIVHVVALERGRAPNDARFESVGAAQINRSGDIAFVATVVRGDERRTGLFAWFKGEVEPLAIEGDRTGSGPLLVLDQLGEWTWSEGPRAVFLGAADANANGLFDPGTDPQFLFQATRGRLTRLLRIGESLDGGSLLEIRSVRLNAFGQVAFQARIDRDADGQFTPGIDTAGIYVRLDGDIEPLIREGEREEGGRVRGLSADAPLQWEFNNRAEVVLRAGLDRTGDAAADAEALFLLTRFGDRLIVHSDLRTPLGTFRQLAGAALSNTGDVVFPAALRSEVDAQFGLFRYRLSPIAGLVEQLVRPGDVGPGLSVIQDIRPTITVAETGLIGFCGVYFRDPLGIEGIVRNPAACFVLSPDFLYEVIQEGSLTRWGRVESIESLELNNRLQAGVQVTTDAFPLGEIDPLDGAGAILFWDNGLRSDLIGPGDRIPGGRVGTDASLIGLSDNGWLAFGATVTDDQGISRQGLFAAWLAD